MRLRHRIMQASNLLPSGSQYLVPVGPPSQRQLRTGLRELDDMCWSLAEIGLSALPFSARDFADLLVGQGYQTPKRTRSLALTLAFRALAPHIKDAREEWGLQ